MIPDLLLILVTHSMPAVREALERHREPRDLTDAEVGDLSALLTRCVYVAEALVRYTQALGGKASRN